MTTPEFRFKTGDTVRIIGRSIRNFHGFPIGAFVTVVGRHVTWREDRPAWLLEGKSPVRPGTLLQAVLESDFVLAAPALGQPSAADEPVAGPDDLPVVALEPHPEEVPDMTAPPTDKAVLAPYYLQASDEDIRKAILNLQFELSQRAYRAPAVKEND